MQKVMIIDDDKEIQELLMQGLAIDFEVIATGNASDANAAIWNERPDIIILDILLGGESGFELCSQLKLAPETRDIPIIFISGKNSTNTRITGYQLGGVNFISKPFEMGEVISIVKAVLSSFNKNVILEEMNYKDISLNIPAQEVRINGSKIHFTSSEFKIIHLLLKNEQAVLPRERILNHISPDNENVNDRMIDTYISSIRKKIKLSKFMIRSVYGEGYKIQEINL